MSNRAIKSMCNCASYCTCAPAAVAIRRETERDYLDAAIGKAVLGDPLRTLDECAAAIGDITRGGVWMAERRILIKVGRAVRELPYARFDEVPT